MWTPLVDRHLAEVAGTHRVDFCVSQQGVPLVILAQFFGVLMVAVDFVVNGFLRTHCRFLGSLVSFLQICRFAPSLLSCGHDLGGKSTMVFVCFMVTAVPQCRRGRIGKICRLGFRMVHLHPTATFQDGISVSTQLVKAVRWLGPKSDEDVTRPRVGSTMQREMAHSKMCRSQSPIGSAWYEPPVL